MASDVIDFDFVLGADNAYLATSYTVSREVNQRGGVDPVVLAFSHLL
jgi:hypothetical protein